MRRLSQDDCFIASNILKELSINQDFARAARRLRMEAFNSNRLGRKQTTVFYKRILQGIKNKRR